jgi:putative ABC transport system permease protein
MNRILQDLRFGLRTLAKNRGATILCILSVALGIGITTALFGIVETTVFRPAPFAHPEQLYAVSFQGDDGREAGYYGWPDCVAMAKAVAGSGELLAYVTHVTFLSNDEGSDSVVTAAVTTNFFSLLGVRALLGQATVNTAPDGRPQAVISHWLWRQRFGGDSRIVGRTVMLSGKPFTVAGVMPSPFGASPKGFSSDVLIAADALFDVLGNRSEREEANGAFVIIARLPAGANPLAVAARLDPPIRGPGAHKSAPAGSWGTRLQASFAPTWTGRLEAGGGLLPVFALLLWVACGNVAQMRLAQTEARKKELGVRIALGSSSLGVARLLVAESALVIAVGAILGLLLANALSHWLVTTISLQFSVEWGARLDWRVLGFTLAATAASLLLAGLAPARYALRLDVNQTLKSGRETRPARSRWQKVLIAGQTASSVAFFGLAILFLQSFHHAARTWPGFNPGQPMIVFSVANLRMDATPWAEQACAQLAAVPGVRGVTFARRLPLSHTEGGWDTPVEAPGQTPVVAAQNAVGPNYFSLMGTRLLAGRGIAPDDRPDTPPVTVVSRQLARRLFGDRNPVGQWVKIEGKRMQIVGVCADEPVYGLHEAGQPTFYRPYRQRPEGLLTLVIETAGKPESLIPAVRQELKRFDPGAVMFDLTTLRQFMRRALFEDRLAAGVTTAVGVLGFLLTAAGLFGVIQYTVNRRTREIGICLALGAGPGRIQRMVLGQSVRMIVWGAVLGLGLVAAGAWCVRSAVLGVTPINGWAYAGSAAAALLVSVAAAWLPARRAAAVDPMEALRRE